MQSSAANCGPIRASGRRRKRRCTEASVQHTIAWLSTERATRASEVPSTGCCFMKVRKPL